MNTLRLSSVVAFALASLAGSAASQQSVQFNPQPLTAEANSVEWRSGLEQWSATSLNVGSRLVQLAGNGGSKHILVKHGSALHSQNRSALAKLGLQITQPAGRGFSFARIDHARLGANAIEQSGLIQDVREIQPVHKLHTALTNGEFPSWATIESPDGVQRVALYVLMHADLLGDSRGYDLLQELEADVKSTLISMPGFVVEIPRANLARLVLADEVVWIEAPLPRMGSNALSAAALVNDSNRIITQVDQLQSAPYNLDGSGIGVIVYDGGVVESTSDLTPNTTVRDSAPTSFHATHVAGTVGGSGAASSGVFRGMAPGVTIESYGFQYDGSGVFLYTNPGDFEADYLEAITVHGVDVGNNSIGTNVETNGFPCSYQGDYGLMSSIIDSTVRGGLTGSPFRIVWAAGNERQGNSCDVEGVGDFRSLPPPAAAKNQICVAALNSNNDSMTSFSSWGPTDDGRLKPDLAGPGCQSNGDGGVTSAAVGGTYSSLCGTSMASPTVTGICALILEDYAAQFGGAAPTNATLKALLIQTCVDRGDVGPDYEYGYGSVRAKDAVDEMRSARFITDEVTQGGNLSYNMVVAPGASQVKLTLAWDDAPGTPNVIPSLVNDLDLVVLDPSGTRHFPWTLDPNSPDTPPTQLTVDRLNNVEQVLVDNPQSGTWTVQVAGFDVATGPQSFSLVPSHPAASGPSLQFQFPNGIPDEVSAVATTPFLVNITAINDTLVGGSPTLHVRYDSGSYQSVSLNALGGDAYQGELPAGVCGSTPSFYCSAEGVTLGTQTNPITAPVASYLLSLDSAGIQSPVFVDNFESNQGWTTADIAITGGPWSRGFPAGGGDREDPPTDADGSGQCFLTDPADGNTDVDGGPTELFSPSFDLSGLEAEVQYSRWFGNAVQDTDRLDVHVSNNGGSSWVLVESVGHTGAWVTTSFTVSDFVTPTSQVRVRFRATDNPNDSVTEAGIDAFSVFSSNCDALNDCDGDGIEDGTAISTGFADDVNSDGIPDTCLADCDNDGTPDELEPDCDGDGLPDDCEDDCDSDGTPDDCEVDCDNDGTPDDCEVDCDNDGTPDDCEPDCDGDGTPDDCEVDCDGDGTPDDCEADCDGDGTPDDCEPDCDGDGTPDDCEVDCDSDGTPDDCEVDCDGDGTPDDCEPDCDSDGTPDDCEVDCDNDGTPDDCEADCDGDGTPDDCEVDCDNDGTPDDCEVDCDNDGTPDDCEADCDGDGTPDDCEPDCDNDGTPDDCEVDCDNDGTPDDCEDDCDNDGTPDDCEVDCDGDGTPDDCEADCDGDGTPDDCEADCDNDGTPDDCDGPDCNGNGLPDNCDLTAGTSLDTDGSGVPDECEDCDSDGVLDSAEIDCDNDGIADDCEDDWVSHYGTGTPGTGGIVPLLTTTGGAASIGTNDFTLVASNMVPGATSILAIGFSSSNFVFNGATILVQPVGSLQFPIPTGTGSWALPINMPTNPALIGLPFFAQVFVSDSGAALSLAASDAFQSTICGQ